MWKGAKYQIQIMEKLPGNWRTNNSSMDPSRTQIKKTNETEEIKIKHTGFSYGLSDKNGEGYHIKTTDIFSSKFQWLSRLHLHVRVIKHRASNQISGQEILVET